MDIDNNWLLGVDSEAVTILKEISNLTVMSVFRRRQFDIEVLENIPYPGEPLHRFIEDLLKPCRDFLRVIVIMNQRERCGISPTTWAVIQIVVDNLLKNITEMLKSWKKTMGTC